MARLGRWVVCTLGLFLLALPPAWAQTTFGTVVGTVTDSTRAVIPQAQVTLTSLGTTEKRTVTTDTAGNYQFVNVLPGQYRVDAEKEGFQRSKRAPVVGEVQRSTRDEVNKVSSK